MIDNKFKYYKTQEGFNKDKESLTNPITLIADTEKLYANGKEFQFVTPDLTEKVENTYTKEEVDSLFLGGPDTNGYDFVDMGEAGIWATYNVGASKPEEYGLYFAWGETEPKDNYEWSTYKFGGNDRGGQTKYTNLDNLTTLELEDDAAHINMGGDWRMPTRSEFKTLCRLCNNEWTDDYEGTGIKGRIFKLKTDESKQLFFPASGRQSQTTVGDLGKGGNIWTSSYYYDGGASTLVVYSKGIDPNEWEYRSIGLVVRGFIPESSTSFKYVTPEQNTIIREGENGPIINELIIDDLGNDESLITKEIADTIYQPIGDYATKEEVEQAVASKDLTNYVTFDDIASKTKNGLVPKESAEGVNRISSGGIIHSIGHFTYDTEYVEYEYHSTTDKGEELWDTYTLQKASTTAAGVMTAQDKQKLDAIPEVYSKAEVDSAISTAKSEIIGGAGADYDTLKEIETWIGTHKDVYEALVATVGEKAALTYVNTQLEGKVDKTELAKYYTQEEVDEMLDSFDWAEFD